MVVEFGQVRSLLDPIEPATKYVGGLSEQPARRLARVSV
jgi:hypothetical protein